MLSSDVCVSAHSLNLNYVDFTATVNSGECLAPERFKSELKIILVRRRCQQFQSLVGNVNSQREGKQTNLRFLMSIIGQVGPGRDRAESCQRSGKELTLEASCSQV